MSTIITRYLQNSSIRRKLLALMMAVCILVLATATGIGVIRESNDIIREQKRDLASLSDILSRNVSAALAFNDPQSASGTMSALAVKTNIIAAYILDANNTVFNRYQAKDRQIAQLPFERLSAGASPEQITAVLKQAEQESSQLIQLGGYQTLVTPIVLDEQIIGRVVLYADLSGLRQRLSSTFITTLLILLQQRQEHLQQLAHFDTLTRLPNRTLFYDRLRQALHLAQRTGQSVAVMFIDLDQFKDINDTLGHAIGDQLLKQAAGRMVMVLRDCDTVARLGGDEFTIFIQDVKNAANACLVAQKILDLFEIPFNLDGKTIYITCSIGITLFPDDGDTVDGLLMNADIAMYTAKADGKNGFRVYNPEMNKQTSERIALQHDLRKALELDQLVLLYQPKYDAVTEKICGFEALIRWHHPERGLISPVRFIPLAEETGLIMPITEWVLNTACKQAKQWYDGGFTTLSMAVNLSALSLKRNNAVSMVQQALGESGLMSSSLELELTESMLIENDHIVGETLQIFKGAGISIALDDFGTGYSSLSYLHRFPIDVLKIDRSFVWNMNRSANDLAMVTAIIAMAKSLNMKVVAEGVETREQLDSLKKCGCSIIQGYYFSKPISAKEVTALLKGLGTC